MRSAFALVIALYSACASAPAPKPVLVLRATDFIARSHAIFDAFDRGDLAAVRPVLGSSYVHLHSDYSVFDRNAELRDCTFMVGNHCVRTSARQEGVGWEVTYRRWAAGAYRRRTRTA